MLPGNGFLSFPPKATTSSLNESTGQLPVTKSDSANWTLHPKRFVDATIASLPFAHMLPNRPETSDFVNTEWPVNMQRALTGEITAKENERENRSAVQSLIIEQVQWVRSN